MEEIGNVERDWRNMMEVEHKRVMNRRKTTNIKRKTRNERDKQLREKDMVFSFLFCPLF